MITQPASLPGLADFDLKALLSVVDSLVKSFISLLFVVSFDQLIPPWSRIFGNSPQSHTVVLRH
jgi:hypothetical protein